MKDKVLKPPQNPKKKTKTQVRAAQKENLLPHNSAPPKTLQCELAALAQSPRTSPAAVKEPTATYALPLYVQFGLRTQHQQLPTRIHVYMHASNGRGGHDFANNSQRTLAMEAGSTKGAGAKGKNGHHDGRPH